MVVMNGLLNLLINKRQKIYYFQYYDIENNVWRFKKRVLLEVNTKSMAYIMIEDCSFSQRSEWKSRENHDIYLGHGLRDKRIQSSNRHKVHLCKNKRSLSGYSHPSGYSVQIVLLQMNNHVVYNQFSANTNINL